MTISAYAEQASVIRRARASLVADYRTKQAWVTCSVQESNHY